MRIDIFHDIACPWCRIGKAHLKAAIEQWEGDEVEVHYHPYFLNPTIPDGGYPFREYMNAKGGGRVPLEQWFAAPRAAGQQAGIVFNFDAITKAPNTLLAHRLVALTPDDKEETMIDALYAAYFEHGRDIGDIDVLVEIAGAAGLDEGLIREQLEGDAAEADVLSHARQGQQLGVQGVPFFVVNNMFAFSGAQPPETILKVMKQAEEPREES